MPTTHLDTGGIRLQQLVKSYGPVRAVRGIDISIDPGETVALLGPNGAGKSTTIDMILGLAQPDSGSVTLFGQPPSVAVSQGRVSGMLQTGSLIPHLTVRELVTMAASLYPHPMAVEETLHMTSTAGFAGRRTTKLSGGQAQRVRFALALVGNPDLLVLDEPTAALDVESRREFWKIMRGVAETGKTVVFATHYLEEADAYADRIILMASGRVVADGSSSEIKAAAGGRTIRATLPATDRRALALLPGIETVDIHGDTVVLTCRRSDEALRAFLDQYPHAHDIEVKGAALEDAFVELTASGGNTPDPIESSPAREVVYR
jgi:ABC-2 type transport system ATP-binding protein